MVDTLYYVADPMCSWCWGFAPELARIVDDLPATVTVRYVMGGLAPDTDEPMPDETREYVQSAWRAVEARTGATFNWDFWTECAPRRSTYPACRAVIAAGSQDPSAVPRMFAALQRAYYLEARNPSDESTLVDIAREIGLDADRLARDLRSNDTHAEFDRDLARVRELGVAGFPSLMLDTDPPVTIVRGYARADEARARLASHGL